MESIDNYVKHGKNAVPIAVFLYLTWIAMAPLQLQSNVLHVN